MKDVGNCSLYNELFQGVGDISARHESSSWEMNR
jgi:hypothetical protein